VLTDDEVRKLWTVDYDSTTLLQFLLLTAQRIGEAQHAEWRDIKDDRWLIPAERCKNGRAHWVALSRHAKELLAKRPKDRALIFGEVTNTAVQSWLKRWCQREKIEPAFTPHDLRRIRPA
jgi:integrase